MRPQYLQSPEISLSHLNPVFPRLQRHSGAFFEPTHTPFPLQSLAVHISNASSSRPNGLFRRFRELEVDRILGKSWLLLLLENRLKGSIKSEK